jgi:hypothetical protein
MAKAEPNTRVLDWLQRDRHVIEGLDHLGIEVVSAHIYGQLLPGITNVTDRARYYSFYPWILHRYAQRGPRQPDRRSWLTWFRRLEYAYALACAAWEASGKAGAQATAVVGVDTARRIVSGAKGRVDLRELADLDSSGKVPEQAYFKNPEGGLGQYYKVSLEILGLVREDEQHRIPDRQLTTYAGLKVAESLDSQRSFERLLDAVGTATAQVSELARLGEEINPSAVVPGSEEEFLLRGLFFGEGDELCRGQDSDARQKRRASLALALKYVGDCGRLEREFPREFRWACADLALPAGAAWTLPDALRQTASAWATYHHNDLMNYTLECLFWVAMRRIDDGRFTPAAVARHIADHARGPVKGSERHPGTGSLGGSVSEWISACRRGEDARGGAWGPNSTREWAEKLEEAVRDEDDAAAGRWALRILGRLVSHHAAGERGRSRRTLSTVSQIYEVHRAALAARAERRRADSLAVFVRDLILEWVLYRHLRVATRKLAGQGVSTFKFRPEHGALILVTDRIPFPTYTNPRLRQTHRILADLHLLQIDDAGAVELTADGAAVIRSL